MLWTMTFPKIPTLQNERVRLEAFARSRAGDLVNVVARTELRLVRRVLEARFR